MKKLISSLGVLALASALSLAEDKPPVPPPPGGEPGGPRDGRRPPPEEMFKRLDTNGDGTVSLEEFKAGPRGQRNPERAEEAFKRMDKDGDGKLTLEELKQGRPPRGPGGPEGGGGKHGGPAGEPKSKPGGQ